MSQLRTALTALGLILAVATPGLGYFPIFSYEKARPWADQNVQSDLPAAKRIYIYDRTTVAAALSARILAANRLTDLKELWALIPVDHHLNLEVHVFRNPKSPDPAYHASGRKVFTAEFPLAAGDIILIQPYQETRS